MNTPRDRTPATSAAKEREGYLGPHRHVDDLLEAAEQLTLKAANLAALFDDDLEADCDAAVQQVRDARATALRDYQELVRRGR